MEFKPLPVGHTPHYRQLHAQPKHLDCNSKVLALFNHRYCQTLETKTKKEQLSHLS